MTRRRRGNGNPLGGLFLLVAGGIAAVVGLFSGKPAQSPSPEVAAVVQSAPPITPSGSLAPEKAPALTPQRAWRNVWIRGHKVPVRSEPVATASIVDRVDNGLLVVEYERRDDWVLIEHPVTAKRGWVSAKRISLAAPAETEAERKRDEEIKPPSKAALTTAAIVALLIKESLADYHSHAPCACPYDRDRRGHQCGARSAWSRPGGYAPLCFPKDVTPEAIAAYRARQEAKAESR